jgi:hypothetical protein
VADLGGGDVVFAPGGALGVVVVQQRLEAVEGVGKVGVGGGGGFELFPEGAEGGGLVGGEEAEEFVGGGAFAGGFAQVGRRVVAVGVAGVDFDDVVDEEHAGDAVGVDAGGGVFGEERGHDRDVPGVFGGVFAAGVVGEERAAGDGFEAVELDDEADLVGEAVGRHVGILGRRRRISMGGGAGGAI